MTPLLYPASPAPLDFLHGCRLDLYRIHRETGCVGPMLLALDLTRMATNLILKQEVFAL